MSKIIAVTLALTLPAVFIAAGLHEAQAKRFGKKSCPHFGYCKSGTCAEDGSDRACNPKNCRAKYCH